MSRDKDMDNIVEVFRIQTKGFDLWAALIFLDNEGFTIRGRTRFQKGETCCFGSEIGDRASLRDRLLAACGPIAAFYGARLVHRKIERPEREQGVFPLLAEGNNLVH